MAAPNDEISEGMLRAERDGVQALFHPDAPETLREALLGFDPKPAGRGAHGRGAVSRVPLADGEAVVRIYRRGGLMRHALDHHFVLANRPLREFELTHWLWRRGAPVPESLGAAWRIQGPLVSGALATRALPMQPLADWLRGEPADWGPVLEAAGAAIAAIHGLGVVHADLNAGNILTDGAAVRIIDFDNARRGRAGAAARASNLYRLHRSLDKFGLGAAFPAILEGYGGDPAPAWLARLLAQRNALARWRRSRKPAP